MKVFIKLTTITIAMIVICSLYFEYFVNRPLNIYIQYIATALIIILIVAFLVYLVQQILKILNP
jgi:hypothetical protein